MIVAGEKQAVEPGSLIFIPPGAEHAIYNPGSEPLVFVSAAAPRVSESAGTRSAERAARGSRLTPSS